MTTTDKPGDPADRAADGAFGGVHQGVHSHRAGYGDDKLQRVIDWLRERPTATLASGEGALLLAEIDRLRRILAALQDCKVRRWWTRLSKRTDASHNDYADTRAEIVRQRQRADRAEAAIARVRALHTPYFAPDSAGAVLAQCCSECWSKESDFHYPCPTLRALDGDA